MQQDPWAAFPDAAPDSPAFSPRPVYRQRAPEPAPVRPVQEKKDQLDVIKTQADIDARPADRADKRFTQNQGLRQEYNALPLSKNFLTVAQKAAAALAANDTPQGDLAVLYAFATVQDPDSVVRESEQEMAKSTATRFERLKTEYNMGELGARLPNGVRPGLSEQIRANTKVVADFYGKHRGFYADLAKRNGFDPYEIVGPNPLESFDKIEQQYIRAQGGTPKRGGVPVDQAPPARETTQSGFGLQAPDKLPGAVEYRDGLYAAMKSKRVKSYNDMVTFTDQFNKANGTQVPYPMRNKETGRAISAAQRGKPFDLGLAQFDARTVKLAEEKKRNAGRDTAFKGGAKDGISLGGGDELTGAVEGLAGALRGEGSFSDLYGVNRDAERIYADYQRETHPYLYGAGQIAGSAAIPGFGAKTGMQVARVGAGAGGLYGFNSAEGNIGDKFAGGVEGMAAGAAGGVIGREFLGAGLAGRSLASHYATPTAGGITGAGTAAAMRAQQIATAQGADDLGIQLPRYVAGGTTANRIGAVFDQSPFGAPVIRRATNTMLDQSESARNTIAGRAGNVLDPESMGDAAITGAKATFKGNRASAGKLYDQADVLNGGTRYGLPSAIAKVEQNIAQLVDTPGGPPPKILGALQSIRKNLDGEWSPEGIKRMRTSLSDQFVEAGMAPGDASRRAKGIVDAAEADLMGGMRAAGKGAAAATLKRASDRWAANEQLKENVLDPILGINREKTGAEVAKGLTAAFKNNPKRARNFVASLPEEQARDIRASVISQMGTPGSGGQNAEGQAFSLDIFLTHWNDIKAVRAGIFEPSTLTALNKLANIAERAKTAGQAKNHSNTGSISVALATSGPMLAAPAALVTGNPGVAAGLVLASVSAALAQNWGARLIANPGFAKRLAATPMTTPASAKSYWSGPWVQRLAATNPEIREPLMQFQQRMVANDNMLPSVAASPDDAEEQQRQRQPY